MNMLASVFGKENLRVTTYSVSVPPQFTVNWETVASPNSKSVWELSESFLKNIEDYKYNKFINIGEHLRHIKYENLMFCLKGSTLTTCSSTRTSWTLSGTT